MEDQAELIRKQMAHKRADLTEKLENIEEKVTEQLSDAQEAVTETAESVKENVVETVETVKESLDIARYVREYPWLMVGGAVVAGFLAHELLVPSGSEEGRGEPSGSRGGGGWTGNWGGNWTGGWNLSSLFGGQQFQQLERFAAKTALQLVSSAVKDAVPGEFGSTLVSTVDKLASSLDEGKSSASQSGQQTQGSGQSCGAHHGA